MKSNLHQLRVPLLAATATWLFLIASLAPANATFALCASMFVITWALFILIPLSGDGSDLLANSLGATALGTAAVAGLLTVHRAGLLNLWTGGLAIAAGWAATGASALWYYQRLVLVPAGVMHTYTGPLRRRSVRGYSKIAPPAWFLERLQAIIPLRRLKVDVAVLEVGTRQGAAPGQAPRRINDTGPPRLERRPGIWNIHRIELAIEIAINPNSWRDLLVVPLDDLVAEQRAIYGGPGRNPWHEPRFWASIAKAYTHELAEELTRDVVHSTGWTALTIWQHKAQLAELIFGQLEAETRNYGIVIHRLEIIDVVIDEPLALRRSRDLELISQAWQQQQAMLLETFQESLERLGLQLGTEEISRLMQVHIHDLVSHLRRYGHLDQIVEELVTGASGPRRPYRETVERQPFRKAA